MLHLAHDQYLDELTRLSIGFYDTLTDETETETFPDFTETETFKNDTIPVHP